MSTLIHRIEYLSDGQEVAKALWMGPLEGLIEIAKVSMVQKGADTARVVVEATGEKIWSGTAVMP